MHQQTLDYEQQRQSSVAARCAEQPASPKVSSKREAWRESVVFGRAKGPIRNRVAYLRKAMPEFLADEGHEIYQFLVGRLVEHIDAARPNIDGMKSIVQQAAEAHDLPITDDSVECVIELGYFSWKRRVLDSEGAGVQNLGKVRAATPKFPRGALARPAGKEYPEAKRFTNYDDHDC